jgi:hypothetical protein
MSANITITPTSPAAPASVADPPQGVCQHVNVQSELAAPNLMTVIMSLMNANPGMGMGMGMGSGLQSIIGAIPPNILQSISTFASANLAPTSATATAATSTPATAATSTPATTTTSATADVKSESVKFGSGVVVVPFDSKHVVHVVVGGDEFVLARHTVEKIPDLYRAINTCDTTTPTSDKYYVDGDGEVYGNVFMYARGNRGFLSSLSTRRLRLLRHEAIKLEMPGLVEDIDWFLNPKPDPTVLDALERNVRQFVTYLKLPFMHNTLMRNHIYQMAHDYLQYRANQNQRSLADEVAAFVRDLATCKEFEKIVSAKTMPSVASSSTDAKEPPNKYIYHVVIDFCIGLCRYLAPMVAFNFIRQQLIHNQIPSNPPNPQTPPNPTQNPTQ